ncbi:hypothetical protein M441DRAFT_292735 [Trichoderma asperellum CBS 433.97]|uniref:Secreted protein n=1 Tax=Trichoderma asperellum (strain ATCC 204424 / CBS 433.97 / NBRC 101777) TaxID=1042311 RepID=A0A2T3YT13_TRIA4|nr:hypothetical protein M441DRAFT_292735 [Trichoderma asperellum CBS 433.97]PTB35712.1 hypothetical protein M441DRAFT_292735 [Trichoderma asperellum CBS 433.97]
MPLLFRLSLFAAESINVARAALPVPFCRSHASRHPSNLYTFCASMQYLLVGQTRETQRWGLKGGGPPLTALRR